MIDPNMTIEQTNMDMTIEEFCDKHSACADGKEWALSCGAASMHELWRRKDLNPEWRLWIATQPGVFSEKELRLFGCWCVRQIWPLLTDGRSRKAVDVAELFADGKATREELCAAGAAARAAQDIQLRELTPNFEE